MYFVFCPLFVSKGVLFNDLAAHYSGAELAAMQARYIGMFQAGWFVESMWSQTLVIHMIRTPKLPEPCISTGNITYHDRYCSSDSDPIHTIWSCTWSGSITGIILCISDPMYSAVYDAGNKLEKSICPLLWRTALERV